MKSSSKKHLIALRRSRVHELQSQGLNETEIANSINVSQQTVSKDVIYIRGKAHETLRNLLHDTLPIKYLEQLKSLEITKKMAHHIANTDSDTKIRLDAARLAADCATRTMDMLTNAQVIDDAIAFNKTAQDTLTSISVADGETVENDPV